MKSPLVQWEKGMVVEKSAGRRGTLSLQTTVLRVTGLAKGRAAPMETETAKAGQWGSAPSGGSIHLKKTEWPRVSGTAAHPSDSVTGCCGTSEEKCQRKRG